MSSSSGESGTVCRCPVPDTTKAHREGRHKCDRCGAFACGYADTGQARCPSWRCDCFIETHPDSPMDLHPEDFTVRVLRTETSES